jgi:hypothetical protein
MVIDEETQVAFVATSNGPVASGVGSLVRVNVNRPNSLSQPSISIFDRYDYMDAGFSFVWIDPYFPTKIMAYSGDKQIMVATMACAYRYVEGACVIDSHLPIPACAACDGYNCTSCGTVDSEYCRYCPSSVQCRLFLPSRSGTCPGSPFASVGACPGASPVPVPLR